MLNHFLEFTHISLVFSSHVTFIPSFSEIKRSGIMVEPSEISGAAASSYASPFTYAVVSPITSLIVVPSFDAVTVFLLSSHETSAPRLSKITLKPTSVKSFFIYGALSKVII